MSEIDLLRTQLKEAEGRAAAAGLRESVGVRRASELERENAELCLRVRAVNETLDTNERYQQGHRAGLREAWKKWTTPGDEPFYVWLQRAAEGE